MTIEYRKKCTACKSTGIFAGFGVQDGAGVVCRECKGLGYIDVKIEYEIFEKREAREDVERVFQNNCGIGIGKHGDDGDFLLSDFGGMPYSDWLEGKPFPPKSEMRLFTCPRQWYQCVDYDKINEWDECNGFSGFRQCPHYATKSNCWERYDNENEDT